MTTGERLDRLEKVIPVVLPPCPVDVATRVLGIYLWRTGLNPRGYPEGDFAFYWDAEPYPEGRGAILGGGIYVDFQDDEQRQFYEANLGKAVEYWKGHLAGFW